MGPPSHLWWQWVVFFWNSLCGLPDDCLYRQVTLDDISDATTRDTQNWAWSFGRGLTSVGYALEFITLLLISFDTVYQLLETTAQIWNDLDICPRTCPSQKATLCTCLQCFAKPSSLHGSLLQLPISACRMCTPLRFRTGCHYLPYVCGRRCGVPWPQRLCLHCALDKRHLVFDR